MKILKAFTIKQVYLHQIMLRIFRNVTHCISSPVVISFGNDIHLNYLLKMYSPKECAYSIIL